MTIGAGAIGEFAIGDAGPASYAEAGGATLAGRHKRLGVRLLQEVAHARLMGRISANNKTDI